MSEASLSAILARSLDALNLRHQVIAQNIANAGSDDFRPMRVDFETELRLAAGQGDAAVRSMSLTATIDQDAVPGDEMRLDLQLVDAAQTSMRYAALVDMMGRRAAIRRAVAGGGQ